MRRLIAHPRDQPHQRRHTRQQHLVYASLTRIQGPWLGAVPASLATSAIGYYLAYRSIYAAEGGYKLSRRQLTAVVAARPARCVR